MLVVNPHKILDKTDEIYSPMLRVFINLLRGVQKSVYIIYIYIYIHFLILLPIIYIYLKLGQWAFVGLSSAVTGPLLVRQSIYLIIEVLDSNILAFFYFS